MFERARDTLAKTGAPASAGGAGGPEAPRRSGGRMASWRRSGAWAMVAAALGLGLAGSPLAHADQAPRQRVIVSGPTGDDAAATHARVSRHGGRVSRDLPIVKSVVADVTADEAQALAADGADVVPDSPVALEFDPGRASHPSGVFTQVTGASSLVGSGTNGAGVAVAVIDTGIDRLPDFAGRLAGGVDLSGERDPFADSFGHGTFVAGLIAGNGASSGGTYTGEAPGASLVAVKVAGADGKTDMSKVIEGIEWAVDHQHSLHIGVINLSLGVDSAQSTRTSPLNAAVEEAWKRGITVVVSAGNSGPYNGTVTKPGDDPMVITAGAMDDGGTTNPAGFSIAPFTSVGPTFADGWFKPDLVAPGRSVVSVRARGSSIDKAHPDARIGDGNFVGSGTSFSAAITSGAAALVLEAKPDARPDGVKGRLLGTTHPGPVPNPLVDGHGLLAADAAVASAPLTLTQVPLRGRMAGWPSPEAPGKPTPSIPLPLSWFFSTWNPLAWPTAPPTLVAAGWDHGDWAHMGWSLAGWDGSAWNGSGWNGSAWNGATWNGSAWNGSAWNARTWNGSGWNGSAWNGSAWNGSAWNGSAWNGSAWN